MNDTVEKLDVIDAYKTDHYPDNGNISEEILVLEEGQAVYINPLQTDQIFDTLEEAKIYADGTVFTRSETLLQAWAAGYYGRE